MAFTADLVMELNMILEFFSPLSYQKTEIEMYLYVFQSPQIEVQMPLTFIYMKLTRMLSNSQSKRGVSFNQNSCD